MGALPDLFRHVDNLRPVIGLAPSHRDVHALSHPARRARAAAARVGVSCFELYRSGDVRTIGVTMLCGVVNFPSFHACLALMTAHACRDSRLAVPARIWNALVIVSAIPMGGHYIVDLMAGAGVFAALALIAARCQRLQPWPRQVDCDPHTTPA